MLSADSHLDLAWSALDWNRNLKLPLEEIRHAELERGSDRKGAGRNTVSLPAMRSANMFLSFPTVLTWVNMPGGPKRERRSFDAPELAYADGMAHVYYYRVLEAEGLVRMIGDLPALEAHVAEWEAWEKAPNRPQPPLGFVLSMEGSDPIVAAWQAETWWNSGLRIASLVHYGIGPYAHGHNAAGGVTAAGRELLKEFDRLGMVLDITHLSDQSFWEAVDLFPGRLLASHHNCRAIIPGNRQLSNEQIKLMIQRDGVIGVSFDDWMLYTNWPINPVQDGANQWVTLEDVVNHVDHICQLAGNARHVGLGTDLDGGYGAEETPGDLDSIADVMKIPAILRRRGYRDEDVRAIMSGNWVRFLRDSWS